MDLNHVERHRWICIHQLNRNGIFSCHTRFARLSLGNEFGSEYIIEYDRYFRQINILDPDEEEDQVHIQVVSVRQGSADRRYFVCPVTGVGTTRLHFINGQWGARAAFPGILPKTASRQHRQAERIEEAADRLLGRNGYPKAKGRKREKLVELVKLTPFIEFRKPELGEIIWEEPKRPPSVRLKMQRAVPYATREALRSGEALSARQIARLLKERQVLEFRTWAALGPEFPLEPLELRPSLDLREIASAGLLEGPTSGHVLIWRGWTGAEVVRASLAIDLRDEDKPFVIVKGTPQPSTILHDQLIWLARAPHCRRFYLVCPRSGRRGDILHLRDGVFGTAASSRLIHQSQRHLGFGN